MAEPRELSEARKCLAKGEAEYRCREGLARLADGLALLDYLIGAAGSPHARTAANLAATYAARIYGRIEAAIDADPAVPEPELEHFFNVVLVFDQVADSLPPSARALKIAVVRRLIDRYYEGHPAEQKAEALRALSQLEQG
jgi:hypothetical protein